MSDLLLLFQHRVEYLKCRIVLRCHEWWRNLESDKQTCFRWVFRCPCQNMDFVLFNNLFNFEMPINYWYFAKQPCFYRTHYYYCKNNCFCLWIVNLNVYYVSNKIIWWIEQIELFKDWLNYSSVNFHPFLTFNWENKQPISQKKWKLGIQIYLD